MIILAGVTFICVLNPIRSDRPLWQCSFLRPRYIRAARHPLHMSGESSGSTRPLSTEQRDDNDELEDAQLAASLDGCLEPRVNPIGVFVQFVWNEEVLLRVYQKRFSWTYRDFVVTDTNGMEVFQLVGRAKSTHMKTSEISRTALAYDCHLHLTVQRCWTPKEILSSPFQHVSIR